MDGLEWTALLLALYFIFALGFIPVCYGGLGDVEVETYTVGCEITNITPHSMGVRNDDFATILSTDAEQFVQYMPGEIVEVEVTLWENTITGKIFNTYRLIGPHSE